MWLSKAFLPPGTVTTHSITVRLVPCLSGLLQSLKASLFCPHPTVLLLGHTLSKQVYSSSKNKDVARWLPALHLLEMALKLCKGTAAEEHEVEAEILFQKGRWSLAAERR